MKFSTASIDGILVPINSAQVSVYNIEYSYGFGVYENIRVRKGQGYFIDNHVQRLIKSAKIINLTHHFQPKEIIKNIGELQKAVSITETYNIKVILIGSQVGEEMLIIMPLAPHFPNRGIYRDGVAVMSTIFERPFPQAKTLGMLCSYIAYTNAKNHGCYDAVSISKDGAIIEGTRTNIFFIQDKYIYSPSRNKILNGITSQIIQHLAIEAGYTVSEKDILLDDVDSYDGAFLTSTSGKIVPLKSIDDHVYTNISGHIYKLIDLYDDFLEKCGGVFVE